MAQELPSNARWLLMDDFNMVETRTDKIRPSGKMMSSRERHLFDTMKQALNIEDNPHSNRSLKFSWDNLW
jgi:hypothetical protein